MKKGNIFWGLFFILGGIFLIIGRFDLFDGFSFWTLFVSVLLVAWIVRSIRYREFFGITFPIAFLCIIYDDFLGIDNITPWPVLGAAAFASIGLSILFKDSWHGNGSCYVEHPHHPHCKGGSYEEVTDNQFTFSTSFSSSVKYVKSDDFTSAQINCSFGEMKVYFDDAMIQNGEANIRLDVSFGGVELYIPKTWTVLNHASASFGAIDEKNRNASTGTPIVNLTGDVSFGGVSIIYC